MVVRVGDECSPIYFLGSVENTLNVKQSLQPLLLQGLLASAVLPYGLSTVNFRLFNSSCEILHLSFISMHCKLAE